MGKAGFLLGLIGVGVAGAPAAAYAQVEMNSVMELDGARLALAPREMAALSDVGNIVRGGQRARQDRALEAARRIATSRDGRYVLAIYELEIGRQRADDAMRARALDVLIGSAIARPERLFGYLAVRGGIAYRGGDLQTAEKHWARLLEMKPNDPDALANLAHVRQGQGKLAEAAELLERAIARSVAAGRRPSEAWYRQRLSIAGQGRMTEPGIAAARALVSAHPSPRNWRDALVAYRQLAGPVDGAEIDLLRTMRQFAVLAKAEEYQRMAQLLLQAKRPAEARELLDEGLARRLIQAGESPTREIIAQADQAIREERRRPGTLPAPQGAGADPGASDFRRGMELFARGRSAEAEAAFQLAAASPAPPGPALGDAAFRYSDLAHFWLAWLRRPQQPVRPGS